MINTLKSFTESMWAATGWQESTIPPIDFIAGGSFESFYAVTDFASAAIGVATASIAELLGEVSSQFPSVSVDRRLSSFWFNHSLRPRGWVLPPAWDPLASDYLARDGWIRLHTNAPHHRRAVENVLGKHTDRSSMAQAISTWSKQDLEIAVINTGGCAAEMLSCNDWTRQPPGMAVSAEPLVHIQPGRKTDKLFWQPHKSRPLSKLHVLDLTRVLAGPVATRFLAGYGANVLRIDPPGWEEPGVVPEVTPGKRCAFLDLHAANDRKQFENLLSKADILIHGYRPGALDALGYGSSRRQNISPGLIDISLSAYGQTGPWANRRGFDSLVQMSTGIADSGMKWRRTDKPVPLPVQALDHATGYLMAATAIRALIRRLRHGIGTQAQLSLARTAKLLIDTVYSDPGLPLVPETEEDLSQIVEATDWGSARRLKPPTIIAGTEMSWERPASALGSARPTWD